MTQTSPAAARQLDAIPVHRKSLSQRLRENWQLYVMLLIPVVLTIVYKYRLSSTVFLIMRTQLGAVKNRSNQYRPTHSLPVMPRLALKSRKAIWMPYMGQYL